MTNSFATIQRSIEPGFIDLTWGQPDPKLLPVQAMRDAADRALTEYSWQMLDYGAEAGAGPLLEYMRGRIGEREGREPDFGEIVVTAGNSDALDQICTFTTQPGDTVLVEAPTYHLAVKILRDHKLRIVSVPTDADGLEVDVLRETLERLARENSKPKFLYTIPTFHNPTGANLSASRRRELIELAQSKGLLIVEDDVYRDLAYDAAAPPSLWSAAPAGVVVRMGSFAKSLAPGLRLGWLTGESRFLKQLAEGGLRDSGGGVNHFAAMTVSVLCREGWYDDQIENLKNAYRARRDTLCAAVTEQLPELKFAKPGGGFFLWLVLPKEMDLQAFRTRARSEQVDFLPASRFLLDGATANALRLSFTLYPPEELQEGAKRMGRAYRGTN